MHVRPTISAVIITYNEERRIRECLESIRWVDEIVLVDSESSDRSAAIARALGARVFTRRWPGCFSAQRNFGLAKATGEWVLILDADERVTPDGRREIEAWLERSEARSYVVAQVPRRNYFFGRWMRFGGAYPDYQWRLLRRGQVSYDEGTSDTPIFDGPSKLLSQPIDHFTGDSLSERIHKAHRDADYRARELAALRRRSSWFDLVVRPVAAFFKVYGTKRGFLDGIEGLLYAVLVSFSTFIRYTRLWELTRG